MSKDKSTPLEEQARQHMIDMLSELFRKTGEDRTPVSDDEYEQVEDVAVSCLRDVGTDALVDFLLRINGKVYRIPIDGMVHITRSYGEFLREEIARQEKAMVGECFLCHKPCRGDTDIPMSNGTWMHEECPT